MAKKNTIAFDMIDEINGLFDVIKYLLKQLRCLDGYQGEFDYLNEHRGDKQ